MKTLRFIFCCFSTASICPVSVFSPLFFQPFILCSQLDNWYIDCFPAPFPFLELDKLFSACKRASSSLLKCTYMHVTPIFFSCQIDSTYYSKHLGEKIFEFAWIGREGVTTSVMSHSNEWTLRAAYSDRCHWRRTTVAKKDQNQA